MPTNIEIKAKVNDPTRLNSLAKSISDQPVEIQNQEDIFFHSKKGRLKLRILSSTNGTLISYFRSNTSESKQSNYHLYHTSDPQSLKKVLLDSLGSLITVKKKRLIYIVEHTRIHLDEVENLGHFMELEVVLKQDQNPAEGHDIARALMEKLEIKQKDLISCAYADLLLKKTEQSAVLDADSAALHQHL